MMNTLAIIGGSGVYDLKGMVDLEKHDISTPYGAPSGPIKEASLTVTGPSGQETIRLLFLPRHGTHHQWAPHEVNYRANICALKMLGAQHVVSVSAVGSLREDIRPGDIVVVDQYIDWTRGRVSTFFEDGIVAHVSLADPVCPLLRQAAYEAAKAAAADRDDIQVHPFGSYLCMQGPQFSTRAESRLYRSWGMSVIGMTALPEAKLAREAQLPYATLAFSTDYDCWHEDEDDVSVEAVLKILQQNADVAGKVILQLASRLPTPGKSPACHSLNYALITKGQPSPDTQKRLSWLLDDLKLPHS